ncbi:hypothetical protein B0H15DRAFT_925097 [Mycena belliarum]|uniref:DUF6593 domain-containing protein n=1 Tax=Mycena belliarum TaxID=1033014 RepID=A0AAD6TVD2_9AGAR|nr:hypothetical protein B0H15DRAFT_925097 [Mycena belliae]
MTSYCLPLILDDRTGELEGGSEFVDVHDRLRLTVRCTAHDTSHTAYMIYNTSPATFQSIIPRALAALDFGPNKSLGTISFGGNAVPMSQYLARTSPLGSSKVRRFAASDRQTYQWARRTQENQEWTCTNISGYVIASYSLKLAGEPDYSESSGCILEIAEQFGALAPEILASLWIMRHIVLYDL